MSANVVKPKPANPEVSLYDPARDNGSRLSNGGSPMQPQCRKRITAANDKIREGLDNNDLDAINDGLSHLSPLWRCCFQNGNLPCAVACELETLESTIPLQMDRDIESQVGPKR